MSEIPFSPAAAVSTAGSANSGTPPLAGRAAPPPIESRQRELLRLLWQEGRLSRWELHERTNLNPNAVGMEVATLLEQGIVRELPSEPSGPGRPRVPLEIDPATRSVLGLAIQPGRIEIGRLNLRGALMGQPVARQVSDQDRLVTAAAELVRDDINPQSLAVGITSTGFIDSQRHAILYSSALLPDRGEASLQALYDTGGDCPIILENDMHALAARWLLTRQAAAAEDVLLVRIDDGAFGAAMLIGGKPNRGCVTGGNELGHTRFFVDTDVCYCGHAGCLGRICSTAFLHRHGGKGTLLEAAANFDTHDKAMQTILNYVSAGLANAANFIRPNRLVLVSALTANSKLQEQLLESVRRQLLGQLVTRIAIDLWDQPAGHPAENAGWLALASLYREGWNR